MKTKINKTLAAILVLIMIISLFPANVLAYVGSMTKNVGGVTASQKDGYFYLKNDYIGFYIRPDGNLTTVPSQKTLSDVKNIGATEAHVFHKQTFGMDVFHTDFNIALTYSKSVVTIDSTNPANPKLKQSLTISGFSNPILITYELVQLDAGATTGTTGYIIEKDEFDSGRTWGVLASASISNYQYPNPRPLWSTRHINFGGVAHNLLGSVRLNRYTTVYNYPYAPIVTHYEAPISSGLSRTETNNISEAFTNSFSYANQFVAMDGYWKASVGNTMIAGIRGHNNSNYASAVSYSPEKNSQLNVEHDLTGNDEAFALWGFRDLYPTVESGNIPADPVSISKDANCVGIINNNGTLSAHAALNEGELRSSYGSKLVTIVRGSFKQTTGKFVFTNGAAQFSPSLTATWTDGSGGLSIATNGTITATGVHLSTPSFKVYKPNKINDTSLIFKISGEKLAIDIIPENNGAILHIDIPGATCSVEGITADLSGSLAFSGKMSIHTPSLDAAHITMTRLGMTWNNNTFSISGVEASGAVDMKKLLGLDVGSATAEINSFPGEERYAFELELDIFEMFEAKGELELIRISNGALIPNTLKLRAASNVGIPLVPPVVVAELNGIGGGFEGLAKTINGDFFAIPPLRLTISAKGTVLETIEGWYTLLVGAGYYKASLTDGELLKMKIIDEFSWHMELSGDIRNYGGTSYKGMKVSGGLKIDLVIPNKDMPFIKAGSTFNASAFAGLDNFTNPTKAYLALGADGKINGQVQIPASAWFINHDLKLSSTQVDFSLGGQTTVNVNSTSFKKAIKDAFGNISGYGGVAYTGSLIGFPYRIYYIFQDKNVKFQVGKLWGELAPFNPNPYSANKMMLLATDTAKQVGIMVMNDNLTLLASSGDMGMDISPLSIVTNDAADKGVSITQNDHSEQSYQVVIADHAPDADYLAFSLTQKKSLGVTTEAFLSSLTVKKNGETMPLAFVPGVFKDNEISNNDVANVIVGYDNVTLKIPTKGTWTISSSDTAFDISCFYASPYAALTGMNISGMALTGNAENMKDTTNYILRTYLGSQKGGTDYLLSQTAVSNNSLIEETLSLTGGVAPTGAYYVTTILLEEIVDDFNGDGNNESAYVTADSFAFDTAVDYTNSEQPNPPTDVSLITMGNEVMRVKWKAPTSGKLVNGYYVRLYQQEGGDWIETGANYQLKSSDLTTDGDGYYIYDMAVTVGDESLHLEANNTYKVGITAFHYLADENNDGVNDSLPIESSKLLSTGKHLPKATYPILSYSPTPSLASNTMKLIFINGLTSITITSDVAADIAVTRMDTNEIIATTLGSNSTLTFDTPTDFTGSLNLKITAANADNDITVDYLGLRLDDTAPLITLDSYTFKANHNTGIFTASGVTESYAKVKVIDIITGYDTSGAQLNAVEVTANEYGVFTITGQLNSVDTANELQATNSMTLLLCASDAANNVSAGTFAQIMRAEKTIDSGGGSSDSSTTPTIHIDRSTIYLGAALSVSVDSLKIAVQAAGQGGTVKVETSGKSVNITSEGLQHLIDNNCSLQLTTGSGTMLITAEVLAGLKIKKDSKIEFVLGTSKSIGKPELQALSDNGYPFYEISILIDNQAVHKLHGTIVVTLKDSKLTTLDTLRVLHLLNSGAYEEVAYTLIEGILSFTLDSLSYVFMLDSEMALDLLKNPFIDVTENDWFYNNVQYMSQIGLMRGTASGTFSPNLDITRAMVVTVLHRMSGDSSSYENTFSDVSSGLWYADATAWAAAKGISYGIGENLFAPNAEITREQLAVLLHRYASYMGYDVSVGEEKNILSYHDASTISDYTYASLEWACGIGIVQGTNGNLNPHDNTIRAEVATMLRRFIENVIN